MADCRAPFAGATSPNDIDQVEVQDAGGGENIFWFGNNVTVAVDGDPSPQFQTSLDGGVTWQSAVQIFQNGAGAVRASWPGAAAAIGDRWRITAQPDNLITPIGTPNGGLVTF